MAVQTLFPEERYNGRAVVDRTTQNVGGKTRRVHPSEARFYLIENSTAGNLTVLLPYDLTLFPRGLLLNIANVSLFGNPILVKDITGATTYATLAVSGPTQQCSIWLTNIGNVIAVTGAYGLHSFIT